METTVTSKGQATIPKHIRDALGIKPGSKLTFVLNCDGDVVLRKSGPVQERQPDRFDSVIGTADIHWDPDELMALMRGEN
jgi:AbrB family looped-hinge helix DNA binding protein